MATPTPANTKVSVFHAVVNQDDPKAVTLWAAGHAFGARVLVLPAAVSKQSVLHLRVLVPLEMGPQDCVDVLCRVHKLPRGQGVRLAGLAQVHWESGLRLTLQVERVGQGGGLLPLVAPAVTPIQDPHDDAGMRGNLRDLNLAELVQMLEMNRKTAQVEIIDSAGEVGRIHMDKGAVVDAHWGDHNGAAAFYALMHTAEGRFQIRFGQPAPPRVIMEPTAFLLLEAMRRQDEGRAGRAPAPVTMPALPPSEFSPFGRFFVEAGADPFSLRTPTPRSVTAASQLPLDLLADAHTTRQSNPFWTESISNPPQ